MSEISIIILTYNSLKFIESCLDSIAQQGVKDIEVIIIDNGSTDGTSEFVRKKCPQVLLIRNEINVGACKARNQGIGASGGEWVLTLDCDVILERDFFFKIIKVIKDLPPRVGMLQPKILGPGGGTIYSCGIHLSWLRRFYDIGRHKRNSAKFDQSQYIFGTCSACALYSRRMLEDLKEDTGYFDERFFFLVEDVDLAWRAQNRNWRALFIPEANCYHTGKSSHTSRKLRQYLCFRNRYYSIIKNEGIKAYSRRFFLLLFYDLPRTMFLLLTNPYMRNQIKNKMS